MFRRGFIKRAVAAALVPLGLGKATAVAGAIETGPLVRPLVRTPHWEPFHITFNGLTLSSKEWWSSVHALSLELDEVHEVKPRRAVCVKRFRCLFATAEGLESGEILRRLQQPGTLMWDGDLFDDAEPSIKGTPGFVINSNAVLIPEFIVRHPAGARPVIHCAAQ